MSRPLAYTLLLALLAAAPTPTWPLGGKEGAAPRASEPCDPGNGGITLPAGFCASVFADELGRARHLAVGDDGTVYVALRQPSRGGGVVVLRDDDGDGRSDRQDRFSDLGGTGIEVRGRELYFGSDTAVVRYRLAAGALAPKGPPEVVVEGFPAQIQHAAKSLALDGEKRHLYVNVGAPSNACQEEMRTRGSRGLDPCPQLERHGGIWRFDARRTGQTPSDGTRYATGIRNAVALDWNPGEGELYVVQHGRDQLHQLWPELYTVEENAELPAEEFLRVEEGADFGWPYCYHDQRRGRKVLAPEYGGDGKKVGRCAEARDPILAFPGHWAPNDLLFYTGAGFPPRYRGGAFIAFHGSWNRAPLRQRGYKVVFVPFSEGRPGAEWEVFADGFAGVAEIDRPGDARFRPMGLAQGPDGALYICDSVVGRVWRVVHRGE